MICTLWVEGIPKSGREQSNNRLCKFAVEKNR
jgi:hypothetical protein